jgi:GNAT superfamily N-acetyltransferase
MAVRIAAAQLSGLSRGRTVVAAPPFTGLLTPGGAAFNNYAVAERPGSPVHDVGDALAVLGGAFAPNPVRFELIDEASPGAVEALLEAGLEETGRFPLLTLDTAKLIMPDTPEGVTVRVSATLRDAIDAEAVAGAAFGMSDGREPTEPGDAAGGGSVLARVGGRAVATAFWTPVADGVTEIAGVATLAEFRNRGLGALATAAAVRAATDRAGVTLAWLTPGNDGADRVYRRVGFVRTATAVHLVARQGVSARILVT